MPLSFATKKSIRPDRYVTTCILLLFFTLVVLQINGQELVITDPWLELSAGPGAPVYTTYGAPPESSRLYGDKAYKMIYDNPYGPVTYRGDQAGKFFGIWMINRVVTGQTGQFYSPPVVRASFPDMAILNYQPVKGLMTEESFTVCSSGVARVRIFVCNNRNDTIHIEYYPVLEKGNDSLEVVRWDTNVNGYVCKHFETKKRLISNLYKNAPYPTWCTDIFACNEKPYSYGAFNGDMDSFYDYIKTDFYSEQRSQDSLNFAGPGLYDFVSLQIKFSLAPGESKSFMYARGWQSIDEDTDKLISAIGRFFREPVQSRVDRNVQLYERVPHISFDTPEEKLIFIGALNLARGCMLPPEGETSHHYYVFSRNPLWGWGHGHQVLHESLSMLALVWLDPYLAMESQRVYMEQQGEDGLIAYRHGPRGAQTYPHKGEPTTSAPFYSWINLELFKTAHDTAFLHQAFDSGIKYLNWLRQHRDTDRDGTFEWGPYGIIENVRDWYNAVFQVSAERYLDVDKEDISDELECLDLTCMVINEARSLSEMAGILGDSDRQKSLAAYADSVTTLLNQRMWFPEEKFYYHVNKKDHTPYYLTRDLRRQEIIGFLPLWARAASHEQAALLVETLTDTSKFWRRFGIPTLAADDPWFTPWVDYCCKWNGPVWLLWAYMVYRGLKNYGYDSLATRLAGKMVAAVNEQLKRNHNFPESFSPDNLLNNSPSNYIWDSIIARLLIDEYQGKNK
ncbi:MAG: hypothetical protein Kow00127_00310 [Bacteroidales bacterium]